MGLRGSRLMNDLEAWWPGMGARIIDGKAIAKAVEGRLALGVQETTKALGRPPRLVVVLVGDDAGSQVYVKRKAEAASRLGIDSETKRLPATASQAEVAATLQALADDRRIDGILLQLPLPNGLDPDPLLRLIPPQKDVDGFHPTNVGGLAAGKGTLLPCTPQGVLEILDHEKIKLEGAEVCIVNHSNVVGKPLALLLLNRNASVDVCHKFTKDLGAHTRRADILITATGVAGLIGKDHIKRGATVIDVGIARAPDGSIRGDVRFDEAKEVAGAITPVPGGVGPLTVAMLMQNVLAAARGRLAEGTV
jgi:methylenetetrahydrofolate dehydrogenase (NADP+) / methenyltetrahydrofolate cyclohydrolase